MRIRELLQILEDDLPDSGAGAQPVQSNSTTPTPTPTTTAPSPQQPPADPDVYLYRGINQPAKPNQPIGRWWSTNPYYSMKYAGNGEMYHAKVPQSELANVAHDASTEAEYQHYIFPKDPMGARRVTPEEMTALRSHAAYSPNPGPGPTTLMKPPENFVGVGQKIFGQPTAPMGRGGGGFMGDVDELGEPMTKLGIGTRRPTKID